MRQFLNRRLLVLTAILVSLTFIACEETVNPPDDIGPGNILTATIDGQEYEFTISDLASDYDATTFTGKIGGAATDPVVRSILITFTHDIENGSFPVTLKEPNISVTYVVTEGTATKTYRCDPFASTPCEVRLTRSNGKIVDGTFVGRLQNQSNPSDIIAISAGEFSVKLRE